MNYNVQIYKTIPLMLIKRNYTGRKAKRFAINGTNQNVWIPNKYLEPDGTIKSGEDIDYVFRKSQNQLRHAGIVQEIPGIKRRSGLLTK